MCSVGGFNYKLIKLETAAYSIYNILFKKNRLDFSKNMYLCNVALRIVYILIIQIFRVSDSIIV